MYTGLTCTGPQVTGYGLHFCTSFRYLGISRQMLKCAWARLLKAHLVLEHKKERESVTQVGQEHL